MTDESAFSATIAYYQANAERFCQNTLGLDVQPLYDVFEALVPPFGIILDAGCGSGRDSLHFIQKGYRVTAFDGAPEMVMRASELTGLPVLQKCFDDVEWIETFDGIWACASLLHVPRAAIDDVFQRLTGALKPGAVLFASFRWGNGEGMREGRLFNDYDDQSFPELLLRHRDLELVRIWDTTVIYPDRETRWLQTVTRRKAE